MKQRTRARRIKDHLYPSYIQLARARRAWVKARQAGRSLSEAMREAFQNPSW